MMVDSQLEFSEDLSSIENVDEILLNSFLEFDFDFAEEIRPSPGKRKVCDGTSQTEISLSCASSDSGISNHKKNKSRKSNERTTEEQQIEYYTKPIYAFPRFDKSDALIYFPNTLSRHMNTGDVPALSKLLLSHCDKKCIVDFPKSASEINVRKLVQIFDKMFDVHPDCVTLACAHQTKIVGNQISSSLFLKFTDIKLVQDVIRPTLQDPVLNEVFGSTREQRMHRQLVCAQTPEEEMKIRSLAKTDNDILIHLHVKLVLTIDEVTKKVSKFGLQWKSTSMVEISKSL
uniref:Uncharacterized protein n=1 Tax=Spumella elongata TaxID=89044 RepID=A0A7S3HG38_9STRA|mmetsp:Transcript_50125/g.87499  ORF Transcript_50125/g.87499 Transcript_50125/m.87499 type:complete len:288 (+) Transcript_50125:50-913(+)